MHVCPRCETPLSNFEVTQGYKDIDDYSIIARFQLLPSSGGVAGGGGKSKEILISLPGRQLAGLSRATSSSRLEKMFAMSPSNTKEAGIFSPKNDSKTSSKERNAR